MIDSFGNIPSHPLLVHVPVVLVPLSLLGALAVAVRPAAMRPFGPLVAGSSVVGFLGAVLAAASGEALENDFVAAGQAISDKIEDHASMGEQARLLVGLYALAAVGWVAVSWWRRARGGRATQLLRRPRAVETTLAVLTLVLGVVATVAVFRAGHSGASSVWEPMP